VPPHRFAIAACARWETLYIAEWLTYHRALGYDHVYLYCNDDDPALLRDAVAPFLQSGFLTFHHHSVQGQQFEMYVHFLEHHLHESEWLSFLDIDEFLRLPAGETIADFTARFPAADCILFNWIFFGTSGHKTPPAGGVLENFTRREVELHPLTKYVARAEILRQLDLSDRHRIHAFWHEPVSKIDAAVTAVNVLGEPITTYPDGVSGAAARAHLNIPSRREAILATAALHHYAFRSEAAFHSRAARGLGGEFAGQTLWRAHAEGPDFAGLLANWSVVEDRSLATFWQTHVPPRSIATKKSAIVLAVRDEVHDLPAWLAWYSMLGFDSFIIYDDDSTDGSWELLESLSARCDIRLARTIGPRAVHHETRQTISYQDAIARYGSEFAWLAFFDIDEFLMLYKSSTIQDFLASFPPHIDQVCINWCNYGSAGHYLKPQQPPTEAYTWHNLESHPVNRHVKSIVRPSRIGPHWRCVHVFDALENTCLPNGAAITWSPTIGIIAGQPDWSVAKLMHYQCRSMEHFVERLKKRPEFITQPGLWDVINHHDVEDTRPQSLTPRLLIERARLMEAPEAPAKKLAFDIGAGTGDISATCLAAGYAVAAVEPDAESFFALQERFSAEIAAGRLTLHNAAPAQSVGIGQHHNSAGRSYPVATIDWQTLTARHGAPTIVILRHPAPGFLAPFIWLEGADLLAPLNALYDSGYRLFRQAESPIPPTHPAAETWSDISAFIDQWQRAPTPCLAWKP
jgi:hypothetical protein